MVTKKQKSARSRNLLKGALSRAVGLLAYIVAQDMLSAGEKRKIKKAKEQLQEVIFMWDETKK